VLDERDRNGVTIDACPTCRGIWLDRGELEKMLTNLQRDVARERAHYGYEQEPPSSDRRDLASGPYDPRHGKRRKKGWLENLGDIFD
jgi:Zn-finger nucleic acid-binding protein